MPATTPTDELAIRIGAIGRLRSGSPASTFVADLDGIRRLAAASGNHPVLAVAQALAAAVARGDRGSLIRDWLGILDEACGCGRRDVAAGEAFAAACSGRLAC